MRLMTLMRFVHAFEDAGVEPVKGAGDDAIDVRRQPFGEDDRGCQLAFQGEPVPLVPAAGLVFVESHAKAP
jgi:hypothetical protein